MADFENKFVLSESDIANFNKNGFVKLKNFLSQDTVDMLLARTEKEMGSAPNNFKSEFNRLKYDFESDKSDIYDLVQSDYFQDALTRLTGRDLFLTFEL